MRNPLVRLIASVALVAAVAACGSGDDGAQGPAGPSGPAGPPGPAATAAIVLTQNTPAATFANLKLKATVVSVNVTSGKPAVTFRLTDLDNTPVVGLGWNRAATAGSSVPNLAFALAKLVPANATTGTPSKWVSYIVTGTTGAPGRPSTDNTGTFVDNRDGTYVYTFFRDVTAVKAAVDASTDSGNNRKADLGDLTYNAALTHRLSMVISGNAPVPAGTATEPLKAPVTVLYDFVPATGAVVTPATPQRDIASNAGCESCHSTLGGIPGDASESSGLAFHGGNRNDVRYCAVCHTEQRKFGRAPSTATGLQLTGSTYVVDDLTVGESVVMIHKIHAGSSLAKSGYNYANVLFDQGGYSQDIRNCAKCHNGSDATSNTPFTLQGDNWKNQVDRKSCGSCHDGINWATGVGVTLKDAAAGLTSTPNAHPVGAQTDDTQCNVCHGVTTAGVNRVDLYHRPVTPPNLANALLLGGTNNNTNSAWLASNQSRLPTGAIKVAYELQSVSRNATGNPVMVFRTLLDGVVTPLQDFTTATANPATGQKEILANFMGGPSVYFVYAVPQDGIAAPADFNASASVYLRSLWNGTTGNAANTLTGPDANGWYTATLGGTVLPANATMLTGGLGYSYGLRTTLPLTQTNLAGYPTAPATATSGLTAGMPNATGGLIVIAKNVQRVATGFTGRRTIVDDAKCNACHQELGTFTEDAFHAGQRNDGTTCSWCHTPNRNSSGWTAQTDNMTHAIHASARRNVPYTWHSISTTDNFSKIKYPGVLARCEQCHIPGSYDFTNAASANAAGLGSDGIDKRQNRYITGTPSAADISLSPYVVGGTAYGAGFSFSAATGVTTLPADTALLMSPTVTACVACHDSSLAISHMEVNGGRFYDRRDAQFAPASNALSGTARVEQCFICHASGKLAGIREMHAR